MTTKIIVFTLTLLNLFFINAALAQQKEDFFSDPTWSVLSLEKLSSDGQWAVVGKKYNNNPVVNQTYFINTKTRQKRNVTHLSGFYKSFLSNGLVVGKLEKDLVIYSLNQKDSLVVKDVKKFDTNQDLNLLFYIKYNNDLVINKLNEILSENKVEFLIEDIEKYYLSPDSNKLVVLNKYKELIHIDLIKYTVKKILKLENDLSSLKWNIHQDGFAIRSKNKISLIDLNSYRVKHLDISETEDVDNLKISFFLNNDLYYSYQINTNQAIPESKYLDIWQANSKLLVHSDPKTKYKKHYKAFVYRKHIDKVIELERDIDKEYLNVGIPGYLLSYNYFKDIDFKSYFPTIEYSLYDIDKKKNIQVLSSVAQKPFYPSIDGKYILYPTSNTKDKWEILDITSKEKHSLDIDMPKSKGTSPIWSYDSKTVLYISNNNIYSYNLKNKKAKKLTEFNQRDNNIISKIIGKESINSFSTYLDTNKPFYFTVTQGQKNTIYVCNKLYTQSIYTTNNQLSFDNTTSKDLKTVLFTIEDYNLPPKILSFQNNKIIPIIESDIDKSLYQWRQRVDFKFKDKFNKELNGYLFYPKNYDPKKKYPMIVQIYDLGLHSSYSEFSIPVHTASDSGFNSSLLTENEYFVLRAQTYVTEEGPGVAAVDCVTNAVNKSLEIEPTIDKDNLGLIGHSFGGYKTAAVSVLSDMFKASVSGAAAHDFIGGFMFRYSNYRKMPDWFMAENSQSSMNIKFSEDPKKYYNNSPLLHAYKTKTAMLLFTGMLDENVYWENTSKMFLALKREQKPVMALFYKNIIHGISNITTKENYDLSVRVLDWFDYHLKNKKKIKWINDGLDYNTYSLNPI